MSGTPDPSGFGFSRRHYRLGPQRQLIELAPDVCPNGHPLGPGRVLVGNLPCIQCTGSSHRTWMCRECDGCWVWPACATEPGWPEWPGITTANGNNGRGAATPHRRRPLRGQGESPPD